MKQYTYPTLPGLWQHHRIMFTATVYYPGQEPRILTPDEVAALNPQRYELTERLYLGANLPQVAEWLHTEEEPEPLASHYFAAIYGIFNYCDEEALNPAADAETMRLFNIEGLYGPLLMIEETSVQPEPTERDAYHYDGDEPWPTYWENTRAQRGY